MQKKVIGSAICAALFFALTLFTVIGLQGIIDQGILDQVVLTPENEDLWGANPGRANIVTVRNFTFYNFTNPRGYLYRNQTPKFNQITNFAYQERSNFTNVVYSQDKSFIDYNYWLYFTVLDGSRDVNQKVDVLNLAPIGFWHQLDLVDDSAFAIQGFGGLFTAMNNTIISQALGQGVQGQFLMKEEQWKVYCSKMKVQTDMCHWLWTDPYYGLSDANLYAPWVDWLYYGDQDSGNALVEYFGLDDSFVYQFQQLFSSWCDSVNNILSDWYCHGQPCSSLQLTWAQLGRSGLTSDPPTGDAMDSICQSGNITCAGYPELYAYYKHVFLNKSRPDHYHNLTFDQHTVASLFYPYNGTFLNIGNLTQMFQVGRALDADPENKAIISKMKRITHAQSKYHAIVIWEYLKYFVHQFVLQEKEGGIRKHAGLAGIFSQGLYQSAMEVATWLQQEYISTLVADQIPDCRKFLLKNIEGIDAMTVEKMCQNVTQATYQNYYKLVQPCHNVLLKQQLQSQYNFNSLVMSQLCDQLEPSLYTVLASAHKTIAKTYGCTLNPKGNRCTLPELAAMQLLNSKLTLNPIKSSLVPRPASLTVHSFNKELPQFEYRHYLDIAYGDHLVDKQTFDNYKKVSSILSFDKFFSVPGVQQMLRETNHTRFKEKYYWNNMSLLMGYVRFVAIEVGFGGLTTKRSAQELLFGFEDPFLKQLKQMDPMLGGDPSINDIVLMNDPNATIQQAKSRPQRMYTGYSDPKITRNFIANINKTYISYNKTYYTGYDIISQQVNPYKTEQPLHGTDAVMNLPMTTHEDKQYVFLDTLYRVGQLTFEEDLDMFGFDVMKFKTSDNMLASSKNYPPNDVFYQDYQGLFNLSFLGAPALVSQSHFLGADPIWEERVQIYDQKGVHRQKSNPYDGTFLILQPKSGATFSATINLQNNIHMLPDVLVPHIEEVMIPVMSVYRCANMTESAAEDLLGPLKFALGVPRIMLIVSICGICLMLGLIGCFIIKERKRQREAEHKPSLLESSQNVMAHMIGPEDREERLQEEKEQREQSLEQEKMQDEEIEAQQ